MVRSLRSINITAYNDKTFKYYIKPPPTSWFVKKVLNAEKLGNHRRDVIGFIGIKYIYEIAKTKKELDYDFVNTDLESICRVML